MCLIVTGTPENCSCGITLGTSESGVKREQRRNESGVNQQQRLLRGTREVTVTREENLCGKQDLFAEESAEHVSPVQADV